MDISPSNSTQQPISDDQELAKALAGVIPDAETSNDPMQFEETPTPAATATSDDDGSSDAPAEESTEESSETSAEPAPSFPPLPSVSPADGNDLDSIRKDAVGELRPLIGKVDLPAEEKFDTYLLLIRSTDDPSLIAPAHEAAQKITDEKRKAEALLDIIKEIDYLSRGNQTPAA